MMEPDYATTFAPALRAERDIDEMIAERFREARSAWQTAELIREQIREVQIALCAAEREERAAWSRYREALGLPGERVTA